MSDKSSFQLAEESWELYRSTALATSLVAGEVLAEMGETHKNVVVLSADLAIPTRVWEFGQRFPERFFDVGIAEKNMISIAAGMASTGLMPYCSTYAAFCGLLAAEQIRTDVAYPNLSVRILGTHSGIAMGFYGTSHHATEDIAMIRAMANMTIVSPCDGQEFRWLLEESLSYPGPIYFRLSRGRDPNIYVEKPEKFKIGKPVVMRNGTDVALFATGTMVGPAIEAAENVNRSHGLSVRVINVHTLKPLDTEIVVRAAQETQLMVSVEEHNVLGGLGGAIAEILVQQAIPRRLIIHGIKDQFSLIGPPYHLYHHYGLDAEGIATVLLHSMNV